MYFEILGAISHLETIATGAGVRDRKRLRKVYRGSRWRKRKGVARVQMGNGEVRQAEIHWYEAAGIGRVEYKIKRFLDTRDPL
jgi:hypothetical protein